MLLVVAAMGSDSVSEYMKKYIDSILPGEEANEEFLELNKEILEKESSKAYKVQRVILPGEEE